MKISKVMIWFYSFLFLFLSFLSENFYWLFFSPKLDGHELAYIQALIKVQDNHDILLQPIEVDEKQESNETSHAPIFVGEVKFLQFRKLLQDIGFQV